jgi:plastocyanin
MLRKFFHINSTVALLAIALSCSGSGSTDPNGSSNSSGGSGGSAGSGGAYGAGNGGGVAACVANTFCLRASTFDPTSLTVTVGSTVTWDNNSGVTHNVVFADPTAPKSVGTGPSGDIGQISSGTQARSFAKAGTYAFHCTIHAGMDGSVTVQ